MGSLLNVIHGVFIWLLVIGNMVCCPFTNPSTVDLDSVVYRDLLAHCEPDLISL